MADRKHGGRPGDSLGIQLVGNKAGLFHDRATGEGGDFVSLVETKFGVGFREAVEWIQRTIGIGLQSSGASEREKPESIRQLKPAPELVIPELSADQLKLMALAAHTLARNPELFFTVLGPRPEISLEAIRGAALDGDLGYEAVCKFYDLSGPAILFGYAHGLKARWPADLLGKRHFRWIAGGPGGQCWRQSLLRSDHLTLCFYEGETDVLSALSHGVENDDMVLAVGLAGAQILPDPRPFAGKEVIIVPDPGEEGARSSGKIKALLEPLAQSVTVDEGGLAE